MEYTPRLVHDREHSQAKPKMNLSIYVDILALNKLLRSYFHTSYGRLRSFKIFTPINIKLALNRIAIDPQNLGAGPLSL